MTQAKSTRELFVEAFGEGQTVAVEEAAKCHLSKWTENKGSDEFRWALVVCIGHDCLVDEQYREGHGIKVPFRVLKAWIRNYSGLRQYDGSVYPLALLYGVYNEFLPHLDGQEHEDLIANSIAKSLGKAKPQEAAPEPEAPVWKRATFVEPDTSGKAN